MLKTRLLYILLLFSAIAFYILDKRELSVWALLVFVVLPVLSFAVLPITARLIKVSLFCKKKLFGRKEDIPFVISVKNSGILPAGEIKLSMSYKNSFSKDSGKSVLSFPVSALYSESLSCRISSEHYGRVTASLIEFKARDILGLFTWKKKLSGEVSALVIPSASEVIGGSDGKGFGGGLTESAQIGDDVTELLQLREYRPGDRLNRIHWKLSSRTEDFIVKEFSGEENAEFCFLIDLPEDGDERDDVLEVLCCIAEVISRYGCKGKALWADEDGALIESGADGAEALLENLVSSAAAFSEPRALEAFLSLESETGYDGLFYFHGHESVNVNALSKICGGAAGLTVFSSKAPSDEASDEIEWIIIESGGALKALSDWSK